jgi:hypothetical protein
MKERVEVVTPELLMAKIGGFTTQDKTDAYLNWLADIWVLGDEELLGLKTQALPAHIELIRQNARTRDFKRLLTDAFNGIEEIKDVDAQASYLLKMISQLGHDPSKLDVTAQAHAPKNRANRGTHATIAFNIPELDAVLEGYEQGQIIGIIAPPKGGKTRLAVNMFLALAMCEAQTKPVFFSAEMTQDGVQAMIEGMLAVNYMRRLYPQIPVVNKLKKEEYQNPYFIHPRLIIRWQQKLEALGAERAECIRKAQSLYDTLNLSIYDSSPDNGNCGDFDSLVQHIRRVAHEGSKVVFIDYLQLISHSDPDINQTETSRVKFYAPALQKLAKELKISIVWIAQMNDEAIKNGTRGSSSGIMGGSTPSQTVDYLLQVEADETDKTLQKAYVKLSRHGMAGEDTERKMRVHLPSGLVWSARWVQGAKS